MFYVVLICIAYDFFKYFQCLTFPQNLQAYHRIIKDGGQDNEDVKQSTADMTAFVQNLLQQMQSRFQTMSDSIITKIDDMGNRIDELEQSINELRTEMGQDGSPSPAVKSTEEPKAADGSA